MKKFLVVMLLLIPVVVLLALGITGKVIQAVNPVEVRELIVINEFDQPFEHDKTYTLDFIGQDHLKIMVLVQPAITYDKTIMFECIDSAEYDGSVRVELIEGTLNQYKIYATNPGSCKLKIYAANNIEASAYINFYITSNVLQSINIFHGNQILEKGETVYVQGEDKFNFGFYPAEALGENLAIWSIDNTAVAKVDNNGCISILSFGITRIWVSVKDKGGNLHTTFAYINTNKAIVKSKKIFASGEVNVDYIAEHIALSPAYTVEELSEGKYKVIGDQDDFAEVEVISSEQGEWDIINRDCFSYDDLGRARVYLDNGGYTIRAAYLDYLAASQPLEVEFSSSDPTVGSINASGTIIPKVFGASFTITASFGGDSKFIDFIVCAKANTFSLNLSQEDNLRGIKQERVWAINWYDVMPSTIEGIYKFGETNSYHLGYLAKSAIYKDKNNIVDIDLEWESNNSRFATVDDIGTVLFYPEACGNMVIITAYEVIGEGLRTGLKRSYTFNILSDPNAINVMDIQQLSRASEGINMYYVDGDERVAVLQNDIYQRNIDTSIPYTDKIFENEKLDNISRVGDNHWNDRKNDRLQPGNDIYGNGFKIKGEGAEKYLIDINVRALVDQNRQLLIENLEIYGGYINDPAADGNYLNDNTNNSDKTLMDSAVLIKDYMLGVPSQIKAAVSAPLTDEEIKKAQVTFRYCYINTAYDGVTMQGLSAVHLTLQGCIISNVSRAGITLEYNKPALGSITLDRLVIRDSLAVGILGYRQNKSNEFNYIPKITIKGFYDAYVWINSSDFGILDKLINLESYKSKLGSYAPILDLVNSNFDKALTDLFRQKDILVRYKGQEYANLALCFFGLWSYVDIKRATDDTGAFYRGSFSVDSDYKIFDWLTVGAAATIFSALNNGEPLMFEKASYYFTYRVTDSDNGILPDSRIPSNKLLYARLQGQV